MKKLSVIVAFALAAVIGLIALIAYQARQHFATSHVRPAQVSAKTPKDLPKTPEDLKAYVETHAASPDPKVQDEVAASRERLAYNVARKGDYVQARTAFLSTVKKYRGTDAASPEYGSIPDQAAYQAIVCLVAAGRKDEAKTEFRNFIEERPLSPLSTACYRRLLRLNGGKSEPWDEKLYQAAIAKQEANARFESSVCGPKTIEFLLPKLGKQALDYRRIAKLCGTSDEGTSIEQMQRGLGTLKVPCFAYRLNRQDLRKVRVPAIWLVTGHYLAVTKIEPDALICYDTRYRAEQRIPLPKPDDPDFAGNFILFARPELSK